MEKLTYQIGVFTMDMTLTLCTLNDLEELRKLSIQTYYETFAAVNTAKNMEEYLNLSLIHI